MDVMYDWTVFSSPSLLVSCPIPLSLPAMCSIWTLWNSIVYGLIRREEADLFSSFFCILSRGCVGIHVIVFPIPSQTYY